MGKRRRADDAAAVSAENEKTQFTCVKLTLNKWLKGDALSDHGQLKSGLNDIVHNLNQAVAEAWLHANLFVQLCVDGGGDRIRVLEQLPWTRHSFLGEWPITCGVAPVCQHEQPQLSAPARSTLV